ncbi:unnamed protein product [Dovyalis caffra]|uniref:25S rRNA (uridine-N(3))-methyltransferase BMT5-like domain-containing protein n=1 Tax=Dovyalis caffra TaxID=77055 RepID=A0AAV1QSD0_9ROSI|nr:unnamed protein product [Dovyalis caffra]
MGSLESQMEMLSIDEEEKWIKHYSSSHKILLVGEGDFSFAACLGKTFGSAANMVATSLYSKETMMLKYSKAATNLSELEELGCTIMHGVDAHTMNKHPLLNRKSFDRIVYNFPATALKMSESNTHQIELDEGCQFCLDLTVSKAYISLLRKHQRLVKGFLGSAHDMLEVNGEIHVTHKTTEPYSKWEIEKLAEDAGLCLVEKVRFKKADYPGFINKRGSGPRADQTFSAGNCCTFKFARNIT